jgi:pyridoxal phosphate-dependent aminotransferase EpsN
MSGGEIKYIESAFESNWIAPLGENVDRLEEAMAQYTGMPAALALCSGTAAMHLALQYLGVGQGDIVFCSDITFAASCNPAVYLGARPVFIDSDLQSWCMSPQVLYTALKEYKAMGRLPKAVIVVDLYGLPADYARITDICAQFGVPIVEDAAEALGSSLHGRMCGSFGELGVLSFNANKIITTSGGGMVLAKDKAATEKMKFWATQAREKARHYEHKEIGYNYRLSNICAGIGRGQLQSIESFLEARRHIHERYIQGLSGHPVSFFPMLPGAAPNCWLTVMTIEKDCGVSPVNIIDALEAANIESRPFWKPMHMQPVYAGHAFYSEGHPVGECLFERSVCLPSGAGLEEDAQCKVIDVINGCFSKGWR